MRQATVERNTTETQIRVTVNLDGSGAADLDTGVPFLDHMLDQLARHSLIDITLKATGDTHIDDHHTVEDSALALGEAVSKALGDRKGVRRYGSALIPMDETLATVAIDLSNRPYLVWSVPFTRDKIGTFDTELFKEWFQAFVQKAGASLNVKTTGENNHHLIEASFKGLARALREATEIDPRKADAIPSTKGAL